MSGSSKARDTPPPSVIAGRYHVERLLGRGGMATVYLCTDSETNTKVAVKVLRGELGSAVIVERFLREIEFASELDHPRVPKVLDSGVTGELPFYVMTYIEGESLRERLDRLKQLPVDEAVSITAAVIEPMTYAHRLGIIHRDIKPGNILVGLDGVYVLDFGIARAILASADDRLTSTGVALGTPAYMSPEQALADHDLDARSDVYSLACVTYEMIAGIPPFVGATPQAVMARRFASPPSPLRETREGVPEHVDRAVAKALSRAPADRWQTAREFSDALTSPRYSESAQLLRSKVDLRRRKYGRLIAGTIGVGLLLGVGMTAFAYRRDPVRRGESALQNADFDEAEKEFRRALDSDPTNIRATLLLARTLNLELRPANEWLPHARVVRERISELSADDQAVAASFVALSSNDREEACRAFKRQAERERSQDALAFISAVEYADCLVSDSVVLASPASPSGVAFRSSYAVVDSLYSDVIERNARNARALAIGVPRLERVLPIHKGGFRNGWQRDDARKTFRALPSLNADTLAFVPYPVVSGTPWTGGDPVAVDRAVARNRSRLREVTRAWASIESESPDAHASASRVLETLGLLNGPDASALKEIALARRYHDALADTTTKATIRQLKLGLDQVRISLRLNRFREAGILADSLLAVSISERVDGPNADSVASLIANVAAIRGRPDRLIEVGKRFAGQYPVRLPDGERITLPPAIGSELLRLDVLASFGGKPDSILASAMRIEKDILAMMPSTYSKWLAAKVLSRPLSLAAPTVGPGPLAVHGAHDDLFSKALLSYSRRDIRSTRKLLDSLDSLHSTYAPGEITMDVVFTEAWLKAAIGDSAGAILELDNALRGISIAVPTIVRNPALAAALVRAMALRADLASRAGDRATAAYWAGAVVNLWGDGDQIVAGTLAQARRAKS